MFTMLPKGFILVFLFVCVVGINAGLRVVRSPQFGSFSSADAKASSGGFGRPNAGGPSFGPNQFGKPGFGGPGFGNPRPGGPGFGGPGSGGPGFGGGNPGFGNRPGSGTNISISKSISISTGNGGLAKSEAKSTSGK